MAASLPVQTQVLLLKDFPVPILEKLEEMASRMSPRVSRNALLEWVLGEYAAGRLVPADHVQGKEAA